MPSTKDRFVRLIKHRSTTNTKAISILFEQGLYGQAVALLRTELDSLIRVCYLLTIHNLSDRVQLMALTLEGKKWRNGRTIISDRDMVRTASSYNHWAPEVYDFGNKFIHLTDYHDYKKKDPLTEFDTTSKAVVKNYLTTYHHFPSNKRVTFKNVIPYLPEVAGKVSRNLQSYLNHLENDGSH